MNIINSIRTAATENLPLDSQDVYVFTGMLLFLGYFDLSSALTQDQSQRNLNHPFCIKEQGRTRAGYEVNLLPFNLYCARIRL